MGQPGGPLWLALLTQVQLEFLAVVGSSSPKEKRCRVMGSWRVTVHLQTCSWS